MKVLKPGDPEKIDRIRSSHGPARTVVCGSCDCIFEVELGNREVYYNYYDDNLIATCPCCGRSCVFR